ncbi:MAG: sigma-70 family RNA polymerase sigma factor [Thermoleophilia bacterium]|nr:sigma-70 family RNA polymerase sigma factor [Thermoleophilia bacterium]
MWRSPTQSSLQDADGAIPQRGTLSSSGFSRYVSAIATQAFRLSEHDAEDVFQDVCTTTFERLGSLRSDDAIRPWVGQLTRNSCLDLLRSSSRVVLVEEPEERAVNEVIARLDEALTVRAGLAGLGVECQEVLDRFFCRDESYRTTGAELGIPAGTIASRISRCLGQLRSELEGRNVTAPPSSEEVTQMTTYNEERLGELLCLLPPAPTG